MTYFDDLSTYTYMGNLRSDLLAVGWLDGAHDHAKGPTTPEFRAVLLRNCAENRANQTRGFHTCNVASCPDSDNEWPKHSVVVAGERLLLGSAEVRFPGHGGITYAAPDLIYHYVVDHGYQPPSEFVDAVNLSVQGRRV